MSGQPPTPDPEIIIEYLRRRTALLEAELAEARAWSQAWKTAARIRQAALRDVVASRTVRNYTELLKFTD